MTLAHQDWGKGDQHRTERRRSHGHMFGWEGVPASSARLVWSYPLPSLADPTEKLVRSAEKPPACQVWEYGGTEEKW